MTTTKTRKDLIPWIRKNFNRKRYFTLLGTFVLGTIINVFISHHYLSYILMYPNASSLNNGLHVSDRPSWVAYSTDDNNNSNNYHHQKDRDTTNQDLNVTRYHLVFSTDVHRIKIGKPMSFFSTFGCRDKLVTSHGLLPVRRDKIPNVS
jgi:hypothetical protein